MAQNVEQVDGLSSCAVGKSRNGERKGRTKNYHYWLKHWMRRKERRQARRDPEGAPTRRLYKGYEF